MGTCCREMCMLKLLTPEPIEMPFRYGLEWAQGTMCKMTASHHILKLASSDYLQTAHTAMHLVAVRKCQLTDIIMAALRIADRRTLGLYFCPVVSSIFSLSSFPRLISAVGDWMSTILLHMVWPYCEFRMQV